MGSKKCTRKGVCCSLCLWVQKNAPVIVLVTLCVCGFKKCTRDVSEVVTLFMGSKECAREGVGCSLCMRVQKKYTHDRVWLLFVSVGSKKIYPRCRCSYGCVYGYKNVIAKVLGCFLRSRVQKNIPATMLVAFRVCGFKKMYPQ